MRIAEGGSAPLRSCAPTGRAPGGPRRRWRVKGRVFEWAVDAEGRSRDRTLLIGVVNVTPDSFWDGGRFLDPAAAVERAETLAGEGADLIDVGAQSTRPGARPLPVAEELARLLPALELILEAVPVPVSVDTASPEVATVALAHGAHVINDVTGLAGGSEIAALCARAGAGLLLMHMRGTPATMQDDPRYDDLVGEIRDHLGRAARRAVGAGLAPEAICVDPGLGFGKTVDHNLALLTAISPLASLGHPVLLGPSRKSFLGAVLDLPPAGRLEGTLAACTAAILAGAHALRVHDLEPVRRAARVAEAIRGQRWVGPPGDLARS